MRPLWSEREGAVRHGLEDPAERRTDDADGPLSGLSGCSGAGTGRRPDEGENAPPAISNFFFVALETRAFIGAAAEDPTRASELIPILRGPVFSEPGTFGFISPAVAVRPLRGGRARRQPGHLRRRS